MSAGPGGPLDLGRPRDLGGLLADAVAIYFRNFGAFLAIGLAIVAPVQLVVSGIGLEELTAPYREDSATVELVIPTVVSFFVVAPLVTAATIRALGSLAAGEGARPSRSLQSGLEAFTPLFFAVLIVAAGVALGLVALILPGIYLFVRWIFVPQTVVLEGARAVDALQRSGDLVRGSWWRTAAVIVVANLVAAVPALLVLTPLEAAAESADRQLVSLIGAIVTESLTAPFAALMATLLYHQLKARRERRLAP